MPANDVRRTAARRPATIAGAAPLRGHIDGVAALSPRHVLALARLPRLVGPRVQATLSGEGDSARLEGTWVQLRESAAPDSASGVLLLETEQGSSAALEGGLVVGDGQVELRCDPDDLQTALAPLDALVRSHVATLPAAERDRVVDGLTAAAFGPCDPATQLRLSNSLRVVRDALRRQLPLATADNAAPCPAHADVIWRLDDHGFYLEGWLHERDQALRSFAAISPEGTRVELAETLFRFPRTDVAEFLGLPPNQRLGFVAYVETPVASFADEGWLVEILLDDGTTAQMDFPAVRDDPAAARMTILGDLKLVPKGDDLPRLLHIRPALERLRQRTSAAIAIDTIDTFGEPATEPEVTVIVPIYHRVEYLEHQLAQFVHDEELHKVDLVYVLDSPEDAHYLRAFAGHLYRLYGVPFRLVVLTRNGGFAAANNLGASVARGRKLLLLNSDILPDRPGWLSELVRFHDETPKAGAVAPKLLYEDESIQHAGLYFDRPPGAETWSNEHYFKGLYRDLPAANIARPVPAVTGACMLISADLYRELGGLQGFFIQGDYEDSDLCLRLRERGYECWYVPTVELYHLEGQSYPSRERELTSQYNKWLHTLLWDESISQVMRDDDV